MKTVVDDQSFIVGLGELFRKEMKAYETDTLLPLAEAACKALGISAATAPVEGYYAESAELRRFFQLVRAMQDARMRDIPAGHGREATRRLREVFGSPAMGRAEQSDRVLPRTSSPLGEALRVLASWSIDGLARQAKQSINETDAGLVAVAAATADPLAICAARESVALVADVELAEAEAAEYVWAVSKPVSALAHRFISALAKATGIMLPVPGASSAHAYGEAARDAQLVGRCILIGDRSGNSYPFYHWYIDWSDGRCVVKDFWSTHVWTTEAMQQLPAARRPATGTQVGPPRSSDAEREQKVRSSVGTPRPPDDQTGLKGLITRLFRGNR